MTPRVSIQCVGNVRDLLKALANEPPGVLVLDRDMPGIGGLAGARDLQQLCPFTRIIVLSPKPDHDEAIAALEHGIGYYGVMVESEKLLEAAEEALGRAIWECRTSIGSLLDELCGWARNNSAETLLSRLTARERQVVGLLGDGISNKEIAATLRLSVATVKVHLTHIFRKLDQPDRLHLALFVSERQQRTRAFH